MTDTGWWCAEMHRVRCFTRNGYDWADRFTGIVEAALRIKASSFLIDGEAVITSDDGMSDFRALRKAARARLTRPLTARANIDLDQYCLRSKCSGVVPTWRKFQCAHWL
jgi:ATP-dependent DNA ligase